MKVTHISYPMQAAQKLELQWPKVMAIGYFDGVHLGHQQVIKQAAAIGKKMGLPACVMTFHPHPKEILGQMKEITYLTPLQDKMQIFAELGIDHTFIVHFDYAFSQVKPIEFVEQMLLGIDVDIAVVGFDFTYGHKGLGSAEQLIPLSNNKLNVEIIPPFHVDHKKVSSTAIREYIQHGNLEAANLLLGRHYSIRGDVVTGDGRGRTIGFPTANVNVIEPYVLPPNGVYAIQAVYEGSKHRGVMNLGIKPTFQSNVHKPTFEAHLFDFHDMIYGKELVIECISYIRPERKFSSKEQLVQQIHHDVVAAKQLLA